MNREEYWKNFRLGKELDVSGRFIYNGLQYFHKMKTFCLEEEIFEFMYNLSVGLERLLKIVVVLIEHDESVDQEEFEKSLITHSHLELLRRIKGRKNLPLGGIHNELLQMLGKFYKTHRYGRYSLRSMTVEGREKDDLHAFLEKHLGMQIKEDMFNVTLNCERAKSLISKCVTKVSSALFEIIEEEARRLNIYTYELRYGSKASEIFQFKEGMFNNKDVLWKELLVFFMNYRESNGYLKFLRSIEPLQFDPALCEDYLNCFQNDQAKLSVMDELEYLYSELSNPGERLREISMIGVGGLYFPEDDEE